VYIRQKIRRTTGSEPLNQIMIDQRNTPTLLSMISITFTFIDDKALTSDPTGTGRTAVHDADTV
jgi:hypothetical protein